MGMMNIKISIREKRHAILDHVKEVSELDICLFIDIGLDKLIHQGRRLEYGGGSSSR